MGYGGGPNMNAHVSANPPNTGDPFGLHELPILPPERPFEGIKLPVATIKIPGNVQIPAPHFGAPGCRWFIEKESVGPGYPWWQRCPADCAGGHWSIVSSCHGGVMNGFGRTYIMPGGGWAPGPEKDYYELYKASWGLLQYPAVKPCSAASHSDIYDCLKSLPPFRPPYIAGWNDCQTDVKFGAKSCCLEYFWTHWWRRRDHSEISGISPPTYTPIPAPPDRVGG